ncbi:MAG: hypothetical protein AB7T49_19500 [Oligoflexales bacterium]
MKINLKLVATLMLLNLVSSACKKEEDSISEATEEPAVEDTTTNISTVSENMVPGSLEASMELRLEGDPCEGTDGFFDCQPNLLKLYLGLGKTMVEQSNTIISAVTEAFGDLPNNKGTVEGDDGESLEYDITSSTEFKLLISSADGPFVHLDVNDNVYKIQFDSANMGEEDAGIAKVTATITYTDEENFAVDFVMDGMECNDDDVQAPGAIAINIQHTDGVAQGKAMMYMPRWMGDNTCESTPTSETKAFIYTDFVGDDTNTTAAVYALKDSVSNADSFSDYEMSDFCTNYSDQCNNGYAFGSASPIADLYKNNFCVTADDTEWGATCDSSSDLISTPEYSDADLWILPSDFDDLEIELPESL